MGVDTPAQPCPNCGHDNKVQSRYCAFCGHALANGQGLITEVTTKRKRPPTMLVALSVGLVLLTAAGLAAWLDQRSAAQANERASSRVSDQLVGLARTVDELNRSVAELRRRVGLTEQRTQGTGPLAARVLPSVYTIETPYGSGAGFAAWRSGSDTIVLTAAHVVSGWSEVTVRHEGRSWTGEVVELDETNDLATVRVAGQIGRPLWQEPLTTLPKPGATLVLFGSPLGYEGTVTRGIVSRVAYNEIQTDAPANPGSSGGPALTEDGTVVGVVTSGYEGRDINFVVPIKRACVELRAC